MRSYVRRAPTKRRNLEHEEQVALHTWAALHYRKIPELEWLLFAIPNAGKRPGGAGPWMTAEGLKSGVWDMFLSVASRGCHGLYIEMKVGRNTLSDNQQAFKKWVVEKGYDAVVCNTWQEAAQEILDYLGVEGVTI